MKKAHRNFQIKPWMGCMGFWASSASCRSTGADGIICFCFLRIFAWFFWGLLYKEPADERLVENETRAMRIVGGLFALLSFLLLFLLDRRGIGRDTVLLFGALGYSVCSVAAPALTYYLDRKA